MSTNGQSAVTVEKGVVFGTGGGRDLRCDVYRPASGDKRTALVFFHGGGFTGSSKDTIASRVGHYAAIGYTCVAAEYRLAQEAKWPAQIEDAKACIRWTRANAASLGVDADRIGVVGFSAGGMLSLIAAGTGDRAEYEGSGGNEGVSTAIAVCFVYYPATGIGLGPNGEEHPLMRLGTTLDDYDNANAANLVAPEFPPTVFFHGTADTTIPLESSVRLSEALRAVGVPVELHAVEGVPHAFDRHDEMGAACAVFGDLFLDRHVVNPRVYPPFQPSGVR
jgi:acetyl esterase/lipase